MKTVSMAIILEVTVGFGIILVIALAIVLGPMVILPFLYPSDRERRFMAIRHDLSTRVWGIAALVTIGMLVWVVWRGSIPHELGMLGGIYGIPVAGFGLGLISIAKAGSYARRLWTVLRTGGTGAVPDGRCAVTGRVIPDDPPSAPITDRSAFAWEWEFYSHARFGPGTSGWSGVDAGAGGVPFAVEDGSGAIRIDPADADLDLADEETVECKPETPPEQAAAEIDLDVGGDRFRFVERILPPGTQVTVIGQVTNGSIRSEIVIVGNRWAPLRRYGYRVFKHGVGGAGLSFVSFLLIAVGFGAF